ncbi:MAG: hypothetical protein ACOYL6_02430 [Bacteriovoracaceae bacterium]
MTIPSKYEHELILFFYPSPGIIWHSPATLALSSGVSKMLKRPRAIGHVTARLRSLGQPDIEFHTGMTQLHKEEGKKEVLLKGYGMGILFHDFKGRLENTNELDEEVEMLSHKKDRLSYIRFEINRPIAERLKKYVEEYQALGADKHYGAPHRPLYGEGGGCGAYVASFLTLSGLMSDELYKAWTRTHLLPETLIGGPKGKKKVGLWKVLSTFRWANKDETHEEYFTWDPDLMHEWTVEQNVLGKLKTEFWNETSGLDIPADNLACPTGPIFIGTADFSRMTREN